MQKSPFQETKTGISYAGYTRDAIWVVRQIRSWCHRSVSGWDRSGHCGKLPFGYNPKDSPSMPHKPYQCYFLGLLRVSGMFVWCSVVSYYFSFDELSVWLWSHVPEILVSDSGWVTLLSRNFLNADAMYVSPDASNVWRHASDGFSTRRFSIWFCWVFFNLDSSSDLWETARLTRGVSEIFIYLFIRFAIQPIR